MDLEIVDPGGGARNITAVATGEADFTLTSVVRHYLNARISVAELPARFVGMMVQRNPLAIFVAEDASFETLQDMAGRRLATEAGSAHADEVPVVFAAMGLATPHLVPSDSAATALGNGEVDGMVGFLDGLPRVRRRAGIAVRGLPLNNEIYASGLLASDALPDEVVWRMRGAIAAALDRQRMAPETGLDEYCRRYPETVPSDALEGWALVEPYVFESLAPGSMTHSQAEKTVRYACDVRRVPSLDPESVYRPVFAG